MEAILASRARAITAVLPGVTAVLPVVIAFTGPARWADNNGSSLQFSPQGALARPRRVTPAGVFFFYAHPGHGAGVRREQVDRGSVARGEHHALRFPEAHLARREVGDHDREASDQLLWRIGGADPGEDGAVLDADVEGELEELVGVLHQLRVHDPRDAQVHTREIVDRDGVADGQDDRGLGR